MGYLYFAGVLQWRGVELVSFKKTDFSPFTGMDAHRFFRGKRQDKKTIWLPVPVVSGKMPLVRSHVRVPTCFHPCVSVRRVGPTLSLTICNKNASIEVANRYVSGLAGNDASKKT